MSARNSLILIAVLAIAAVPAHAEVRIGLAVADLNAGSGVLGEQIELTKVDDYCDGEQAVAAARKLLADGVVMVFGHQCSGAAIPASEVYADADVLMISTFATNPRLTERGLRNVFRVVGRDDLQGEIAAELLAKRWGSEPIAILHDGEAYDKGLAEETKEGLNRRGVAEALFEEITPGQVDYFDVVEQMRADGVAVLYYGGYAPEAALIIRQARSADHHPQLVSGDALANEDFGLIAGAAADGAMMTSVPDPASNSEAAALTDRLDRPGNAESAYTAYAAVQAWAQAVELAGTFETKGVADALRASEFETVLGPIGFDDKGDVTGYDTFVWYRWQNGDYAPVDPAKLTE